jgi:hypothetical protein
MKRLFFLMPTFFVLNVCVSQTETRKKPDPGTDPGLQEFIKKHDERLTKQNGQVALNALYFGYEATLRSYMEGNIIPAAVPQATGFTSKTEYVKAVNAWLSNNQQYLKPEHKKSLITE